MKTFYHKISKIEKNKILESTKEFNKIKEKIEEKIIKSKDNITNEIDCYDRINDAFVDALLKYNEQNNFGIIFSICLNNYRKPFENDFEKNESIYMDKYFYEKNYKELIKTLEKIIRKLKPRRKFYYCLRNHITFDKPKDECEKNINQILKNKSNEEKITYVEIAKHFAINFNKKTPSKQCVEDTLKRTNKIIEKEILENNKIKELKEIFY